MAEQKFQKILLFEGLIAAPFTAFTSEGEVNTKVIPDYVEHLRKNDVKGVFVNGTTGEGLSLTVAERKAIAEGWIKYSEQNGDLLDLIIIHVGANSIEDVKEMAAHAEQIGATGIAALPPLFYKHSTLDHLVKYYKKISEAAPNTPLMLYHIPDYSGVEIRLGDFLPKMREAVPMFVGAKYTSVDVRDLLRCHALPGKPFKLLSGYDEVLLPMLSCGITAAVGASYNFAAPLSHKILKLYKEGKIEEARREQNFLLHFLERICRHGQVFSCLKATMTYLSKIDFGNPRAPLVPLDDIALGNLIEDIKKL